MPRPFASCLAALVAVSAARAADRVDYAAQVRPLFEKHCVSCHGEKKQKGGLRLDLGSRALRGGLNGPVVVPAKAGESRLVHALKGERDAEPMPPAGPLADADIALIARWIDEGATVPAETEPATTHWAFLPPKQAAVPAGVHPVDHFLDAERARRGVTAAPTADPGTLVRRLHLDLVGLPPTPAEAERFERDGYEKRVDELLASPQYGERWGRHLLDVWRYSDWYGYGAELRNSQKHIWHWRDWVVESLNANKPYDRMVREMLAGDELAPTDPGVVRATGFLARSYYKFNRNVWLDDIVEHTGKAFLGVTLNCARCHDHMYDPIAQADYFRVRAVFEPHQVRLDPVPGEADPEKRGLPRVYDADLAAPTYLFERGDDKRPVKDRPLAPGVPAALSPAKFAPAALPVPVEVAHPTLRESVRAALSEQARKPLAAAKSEARTRAVVLHLQAVQAKLAADRARYSKPPAPHAAELTRHAVALHLEALAVAAEADLADAEAAKPDAKKKPDLAALRKKVEAARKACETPPADYPPLVPQYPERSTGRRLAFADWIAAPDNPLTARVFVNHVWLRHFGEPLVPTVFDFGKNGRPPSHPELLDWLAVEFVRTGWDVKRLHRLILTSRAYRMRSSMTGAVAVENRKLDPDNRLLWRQNPRPLEAEAVRDSLLHVAGLLDPTRGGPDLDPTDDKPPFRRSLYLRHAPEKSHPFLTVFDGPSPTECYRRPATVVPQQALALVNSPLSARAAEAVAQELPAGGEVGAIFDRLLGRPPTADEAGACEKFLEVNPPAALVQAVFSHADFTTIR